MKKSLIILGSTGSIGSETLSVIKKKDFNIKLITTNRNIKKLLKQAIFYKVKNVIVEDKAQYIKNKNLFKKNNINLFLGLKSINKIIKNRINYCINSISGINGLEPTLNIIPFVDKILIANKESIICGWILKLFNIQNKSPHRAMGDVNALAKIWGEFIKQMKHNNINICCYYLKYIMFN